MSRRRLQLRLLARAAALALALATTLAAAGASLAQEPPPPAPDTVPSFSGFARLFNVDAVTVVYPAGEGAPPHARLVAERLAAFLSARHRAEARAVADSEVGPAERAGHLLALGWSNALLDPERPGGVAPPWTPDGAGFALAPDVRGTAEDDLLFLAPSPFAEDRWLGFWSRIDAERARFSPIPALGSDWGILRAHKVWTRGLFDDAAEGWPPRLDPYNLVADPAEPPAERIRSGRFAVHHDPGRIGADARAAALEARERALATAGTLLEPVAPAPGRASADEGAAAGEREPFRLYLYRDVEDKIDRTGVPDPVHDVAERGELHMTLDYARASTPLEEIQLLARRRIGPCYHTAFCEGLPLALMLDARRDDADELGVFAGLLLESATVPAIDALLDEETLRAGVDAGRGYATPTLFVAWLLEAVDRETFAALYRTAGLDAAGIARALGSGAGGADAADAAFGAYLERRAAAARVETEFRKALAEAFRARETGDEAGARAGFRRALELRPEDLETRYLLALSLRDEGRAAEALEAFRDVAGRAAERKPGYFLSHALYEAAELERRAGRADEARTLCRRVLELPDVRGAHELCEETLGELDGADAAGGDGG